MPSANKLCTQQPASLLSKKASPFFDILNNRRLYTCGYLKCLAYVSARAVLLLLAVLLLIYAAAVLLIALLLIIALTVLLLIVVLSIVLPVVFHD